MSIDVADFNNDLNMDIYISGITSDVSFFKNSCRDIQNGEERKKCEKNIEVMDIVRQDSIERCSALVENKERNNCIVMTTLRVALTGHAMGVNLCDKIPNDYAFQRLMCFVSLIPVVPHSSEDYTEAIEQLPRGNVLLQGGTGDVFQEVTKEKRVASAFKSWNAKFADLDNDEWQDIYIGTGELVDLYGGFQPNVFFRNYGGEYFLTEQEEFGLEHVGITESYSYIDIDNDGDLDIITVPVNGPLNVYINNETQNNSITFEFRDKKGNFFGMGNKTYIYYGKDSERHQVRQIKSGGGFLSFDSPIAHFGLGKYDRVNKIEIIWSTGEKTTLDKELLANKNYVITRKK